MIKRIGLIFVLSIIMIGCQQQTKDNHSSQKNNLQQMNYNNNAEEADMTNQDIALHLSKLASDVPNVNGATAIVAGPYAVVGIDVDKHLDRSRVGTIKYSVSEALKDDPYGKTAVVIADGDIMERIRQLGLNMKEGHPIQGIVDELSGIVGRYMPTFPINDNMPVQPDQNKEILPDEDQRKLDEIEKEQSNEDNNK